MVYEYTKAGRSLSGTEGREAAMKADPVDYRQMDAYRKAFTDRVIRTREEARV